MLLLLFDINGLFIESIHQSLHIIDDEYDFKSEDGYYIYVRPFTKILFEYVFNNCQVGFWSSLNLHNTLFILEKLVSLHFLSKKQYQSIEVIYTKEDCVDFDEYYDNGKPVLYKDLNSVWGKTDMSDYRTRTLLIDTNQHRTTLNKKSNLIVPSKYYHLNCHNDNELLRLRSYIEFLVLGVNNRLMNKNNYTSLIQVNSYELFNYPYQNNLSIIEEDEHDKEKRKRLKCFFW